jgi:hypothetical protein
LSGSDNIIPFKPELVGEAFRFDCDALLDAAKGRGFDRLVIIADYADGPGIWVSGSANAGESVMLIEAAKHRLLRPMLDDAE